MTNPQQDANEWELGPDRDRPLDKEPEFAELLATYDQSLTGDLANPIDVTDHISRLGLLEEFERAKECLELIGQIWPRTPSVAQRGENEANPPEQCRLQPSYQPPSPQRQLGRFEIRRELGRGGGGIVYLAFDPKLKRNVALKLPHPESLFNPELRERFLHEAQVAAGIDHPNIVPVYEIGEAGPICFIAAAYCLGATLADWLQTQDQPISQHSAARLVSILATAIEHAHAAGILHRDLKPSNVLLEPIERKNGSSPSVPPDVSQLDAFTPKLTDFGLAKMLSGDSRQTRNGVVLGTPEYMAPEQAEGRLSDIGPATDVYALGAILYELLTGRSAFRADSDPQTLRQIVFDEPARPRRFRCQLDLDLEAICLKCLEKRPEARYAHASELASDLESFLSGRPTVARPTGITTRGLKWMLRRPAMAALFFVSILSLVVVCGLTLRYRVTLGQVQQASALAHQTTSRLESEATIRQRQQKRHEYVDHVSDAYLAWSNGEVASAIELLQRCVPIADAEEQRGFEWYYVRRLCEGGLRRMNSHQGLAIRGSSFSADGTKLATCGDDDSIHIWDPSTAKLLRKLTTGSGRVSDVEFSSDGQFLASVDADGRFSIWDAESYLLMRTTENHSGQFSCLAIAPDCETIAVAGDGGLITVWDTTNSSQPIRSIDAKCDAVFSLDFSVDGKLAAACSDKTARIWDLNKPGVPARVYDTMGAVNSVAFSGDGRHVAVATDSDWLLLDRNSESFSGHVFPAGTPMVLEIAFSPDSSKLAISTVERTGRVQFVDVHSGAELDGIAGHHGIAFSPQGSWFAAESPGSNAIELWDLRDNSSHGILSGSSAHNSQLAVSADGKTLASASHAGAVRLWDVPQRREIRTMRGHVGRVSQIQFSPHQLALVTAGEDGSVQFWDISTGRSMLTLRVGSGDVLSFSFSADGQILATSCQYREHSEMRVDLWYAPK